MYESWNGNQWFGSWLSEDCLTWRSVEAAGIPVTTAPEGELQGPVYESVLGMRPQRVEAAHFDELVLSDDPANNHGKSARARGMYERLLTGRDPAPIPEGFMLRGQTGAQRRMASERQIAERLEAEYRFSIIDPTTATMNDLAAVWGQARVVVGVEGSHLAQEGIITMPESALLFVIQPPQLALAVPKALTDRQGQGYAFAVAEGGLDGFTADWEEIKHTLDMALAA